MEQSSCFFSISFHLSADQLTQGKDHRIGYFVTNRSSVAFPLYQMIIAQHSQMFRYICLFHRTGRHQLTQPLPAPTSLRGDVETAPWQSLAANGFLLLDV